ncbi:MAG TPA: hypothetical protein DEP00_08195 [Lachnospiraceae bacterium]|jgi:hypothetical protein|nr:hypothetical protein [Lachnospiraceae bacterium]
MMKGKKKTASAGFLRVCAVLILASALLTLGSGKVRADQYKGIDTINNQVIVQGKAKPGTLITVIVFNYRYGNDRAVLYYNQSQVGESGLYQEAVPLPVTGYQYVQTTVGDQTNILRYNRFSRQMIRRMEDLTLNLYDYYNDENQ